MTWQKFMTFAHQNIEIRPIPFVEPPAEDKKKSVVASQKTRGKKKTVEVNRPKVLSAKSQIALRALEKVFKAAPPTKLDRKVAGAQLDLTVRSN